jgi:asparagine synthase (glutamine-hydrolysing)
MELKELLSDTLSAERLTRRGLFEPAAVQRLIEANNEGRLDASYTLLSLLCIELWCKAFIDQPVSRSPSHVA